MKSNAGWTRQQQLIALRLYVGTPFGKLHGRNPRIIALAEKIGRTPAALAMKACNFASLDPAQKARKIKALGNVSRSDRELWEEFSHDSQTVAAAAESAYERLGAGEPEQERMPDGLDDVFAVSGPTERECIVRVRRVQAFFRAAVLTSYQARCALSGIAVRSLLNASHIMPWSKFELRRADPRNGICLNALYDRAFDLGFITFDEDLRLVVSSRLKAERAPDLQHKLLELEGQKLSLPRRFPPDQEAMAWHREHVFAE